MLQFCCLFLTQIGKDHPVLSWISATFHLVCGVARLWLGKRFLRSEGTDQMALRWNRIITFGVLIAWSLFAGLALQVYGLSFSSVYVFAGLVAMLFGAAAVLSPDLTIGRPFTVGCLLPLWAWGITSQEAETGGMITTATIGLFAVTTMQTRQHQTLCHGILALLQLERQAEELQAAKESAEQANLSKTMFLANISHEIRTPLSGVIGLTNLLAETTLEPWQRELVDNVQSSGELLLALVNDVLDFSKITAGKLEVTESEFELRHALRDTVAPFRQIAAKKELEVRLEIPDTAPVWVAGDVVRVRQVLSNLIGNAVKFTAQGCITVTIAGGSRDSWWTFAVSDTGIGIRPEAIGRLFQRFSQADGSTTRRFGGTGLGLAISKRLVELMGGKIGAESIPGQGSRFWFTLPLRPVAAPDLPAAARAPGAESRQRGNLNILIAEDNPVNQTILRSMVSNMGHRVHLVENGRLAYEAVQEQDFDLVLMDWQMPEMDALEATAAIRDLGVRGQLPIIAVTANAFVEDRERCLEGGMNDHVAKPVRRRELEEAIERWCGSRCHENQPANRP
jgi:signal transduction histidine kinase/ActR/RegA family two-component response regulator